MAKINKKTILYAIGIVALLVIAYYSRALHTQVDEPILKMLLVMIRSVIQISLVIGWCSSVRTGIINKQVRHYLISVGILAYPENLQMGVYCSKRNKFRALSVVFLLYPYGVCPSFGCIHY